MAKAVEILTAEKLKTEKELEALKLEKDKAYEALKLENEGIYKEYQTLKKVKFDMISHSNDIRVDIFSRSGSSRTPSFEHHDYWRKCLCCGTNKNVTRAHLLVNNVTKFADVYPNFGTKAGYTTDFDGSSERNHIPLCGTLGVPGSCHNSFDSGEMTLIYDPFTKQFRIYWPKNKKHHNKTVKIPKDKMPYRRILVWRARHDGLRKYDFTLLNFSNLEAGAKSSETGSDSGPAKKRARRSNAAISSVVEIDSWNIASAAANFTSKDINDISQLEKDGVHVESAIKLVELSKQKSIDIKNVEIVATSSKAKQRRDSRFPEKEGWELHILDDGSHAYFNTNTNRIWYCYKGG